VTNADELKDFDLQPLFALHASTKAIGTIALTKVEDPSAYGIAHLEDSRIVRFIEKPKDARSNLANAGLYLFSPKVFDLIPDGFSMTETEVFPQLAKEGVLHGLHLEGQWFDTGTLDRYEQALNEWKGFTFR
jgi:mannose-1-phosphate guanylyltransferase